MALTDKLTAIADAIRGKTGSTDAMTLDEMAEGITGLDTSGGSSSGSKYNVSIDNFLGDIDDDGVLQVPSDSFSLIFTGVKDVGDKVLYQAFSKNTNVTGAAFPNLIDVSGSNGMYYVFYNCTGLTSVDLSSLTDVSGSYGMYDAFYGCTGLTSVDLSSLTDVSGSYGMRTAFYNCTGLTSVDLSSLTDVSGSYGMRTAFYNCTGLTSVDLSALETIGTNGMYGTFQRCTGLTSVDLSALETIGTNGMYYTFNSCTSLTSLDLPSLTSLSDNALYGNSSLTKIWIPSTCTTISASAYSYSPFYQCSSSLEIFTDAEAALDGWGAYWNYCASEKTLTVHYGATHEEFEQGYMNPVWTVDSAKVDLTDYGITITGDVTEGDTITVTVTVGDDANTVETSFTSDTITAVDVDSTVYFDSLTEDTEIVFTYATIG